MNFKRIFHGSFSIFTFRMHGHRLLQSIMAMCYRIHFFFCFCCCFMLGFMIFFFCWPSSSKKSNICHHFFESAFQVSRKVLNSAHYSVVNTAWPPETKHDDCNDDDSSRRKNIIKRFYTWPFCYMYLDHLLYCYCTRSK